MPLEYRLTGVSRNFLDAREIDDLVELAVDLPRIPRIVPFM
jgi:hypothetical protein